ncbi:MAG: DNA primase [Chlamydiia bacterium]|nr:DNA primase [Chlamydiia bacterium]
MALFTKESLERLRDRIDIAEVIASHVEMKKSGATYKGLCPFHDEKTPSFMIHQGDKHYHCFGCGAHGDAIQFLTQHVRLSFSDAVESLAERFQVKLEKIEGTEESKGTPKAELRRALDLAKQFYQFHLHSTPEGKKALAYLKDRGMDLAFVEAFDLGWAPSTGGLLKRWLYHNKVMPQVMQEAGLVNRGDREFFSERILFPIKDYQGHTIGFSGRKIREEVFGGKYINTSETPLFKKSKVLFGIDRSRKRIAKERRVLVVEGQIDCLKLIHAGLDLTVAGQGTAFGEGHVKELLALGVKQVFLALDSDQAGIDAAIKIGDLFQKVGVEVRVVELPFGEDPDQFVQREGIEAFLKRVEASTHYLSYLVKEVKKTTEIDSAAGKAAMVNEIATQIKKWEDPIMVHESLRQLAKLAQVPESFVCVGELAPRSPLIRTTSLAGKFDKNPDQLLEGEFLRTLVYSSKGHFMARCQEWLKPEDFHAARTQEIFQALLKRDLSGLSPESQALLDELSKKSVPEAKAEAHFKETLQKILDRNWLRKREEIKVKIQSNRYSEEEVIELVKQFDQLKQTPPKVIDG